MNTRTHDGGTMSRRRLLQMICFVAIAILISLPAPTRAHEGGLEITISPPEIAAGDEITVSGEGFPPNQPIELHLTGPNGDAHLANVAADDDGAFTQQIVVPGTIVPGLYLIRAEGGQEATAELSVGAMPGMQAAAGETLPERERSPIWKAGAVIVLVVLGGMGLALAQSQGYSSVPRPAPVRPESLDRGSYG